MERRQFAGLDVVVENPAGSVRQWHDRAAGKSGETVMRHDYGYLADHMGSDGDEVDCYLGPDESAAFVHVVHQLAAPDYERHDEDKVMLGFADEVSAKAAYLAHRDDGERAYGGMTSMPLERFKSKLERRTGDGKIRHERMANIVTMRIEHRGSKWVVLPESGDKVLGAHDTKEEAEKQLAAIEASKARAAHELRLNARHTCAKFEVQRGPDGGVRSGVWDRICVPTGTSDVKDGMETEFTVETMSQMVDNFAERGDQIPVDHNHQTNYAAQNGKPAPALAWYGALCIVSGGRVVHGAGSRDVSGGAIPPPPSGSADGLWGYRTEVTPLGQSLLPNYKYLSPTFTPEGTRRDGSECGYCLLAVAATNSPFQEGTQITFHRDGSPGASGAPDAAESGKEKSMAKLAKLATFAGQPEDADDAAIKHGLEAKMDDVAMAAASEEGFDYAGHAAKMEEAAQAYEDAHMDAEDGDGDEPHVAMRKMAAKFRKLAKMAEPHAEPNGDEGKKPEMARMEEDKKDAEMATMSATLAATKARLEKLEAAEREREQSAKAEREARFESLADQAIAGGYPKDKRAALISFARVDYAAAKATVEHLLPAGGAPAHLFDRVTQNGAPVGKGKDARTESGPKKPARKMAMGLAFQADDEEFADEIKRLAESKDPVEAAKVDKLIAAPRRTEMFDRLQAAAKVVRAEKPELALAADGE